MATIARIRVALTGVTGLPGVSTFYSTQANVAAARSALGTFYGHMPTNWPNGMTYTVENSGDLIDSDTGKLTGAWTDAPAYNGSSSVAAAPYAAGVGARVYWNTTAVVAGRRLKGSTFIVPLQSGMYGNDGTLDSSYLGSLQTWATTLATSGYLGVYKRPYGAPGALAPGFYTPMVGATVKDQVATLRSRRF